VEIAYRQIPMRCSCGQVSGSILDVGLMQGHQLVVHWWCEQCRKMVSASRSLADCWRDCPDGEFALDIRPLCAQRTGGRKPAFDREDTRSAQDVGTLAG
jgi:hypothetical protein